MLPTSCVDVTTCLLLALVAVLCCYDQVAAVTLIDDNGCFHKKCGVNEFCCDGQCCSYFARNWLAWVAVVILLSSILITCFCLPRQPWVHEPIRYTFISKDPCQGWNTIPYKQQPTIMQYDALVSEEENGPYRPYRCERLVQQSPPHYPLPSAPPKTP